MVERLFMQKVVLQGFLDEASVSYKMIAQSCLCFVFTSIDAIFEGDDPCNDTST